MDEAFARSFRAVFDGEFPSLFRYLNRLTGDSAAATDIAQEALVRLYQRGAVPDDPRAWLATVANNLVRDEHRRSKRRKRLLEGNPDMVPHGTPTASPEEEIDRRQRTAAVRRALDRLPERHRQALLLRHEGYSYREIASALGCRASGVGKLIVRATRAFRQAYEGAHASD